MSEQAKEFKCVTGKNPYGNCGAAQPCGKDYECCADCPENCNSRCGYLDKEPAEKAETPAEEPAKAEPIAEPQSAENPQEEAEAKLRGEIDASDKMSKPIAEHLIERVKESESLAADVMQKHKTLKKCLSYIVDQARKELKGKSGPVEDSVVYEWAEDYYHKDDKAEEEKKAKEEAKRKQTAEENRKKREAAAKNKKPKKEDATAEKKEQAAEAEEKPAEAEQKPKKASKGKEIEGQMDLFSMMNL